MSLYYNLNRTTVKKIAILASGSGSNAENIANYFKGSDYAEVSFIIANNPDAYVIERAQRHSSWKPTASSTCSRSATSIL